MLYIYFGVLSCSIISLQAEDSRSSSPPIRKKVLKHEEDDVFSSGGEEVASITGKSKGKKSKKMSKKIKTRSESTKSPDLSESPETPTSAKPKKTGWFRKRSSSDSKALKRKSTGEVVVFGDIVN